MAQARQRRAGERIEGAAARHATVALQSVRMAMQVNMIAIADRTVQSPPGHAFDQCRGSALRCASSQQSDTRQALATVQYGELGDEGFPLSYLHERLPFVCDAQSDSRDTGRFLNFPYLTGTEPK